MSFFSHFFRPMSATEHSARQAVWHMQQLTQRLPDWVQDWLGVIVPGLQIVLIVLLSWLLQGLLRRLVRRAGARYQFPDDLLLLAGGLIRWLIMGSALLLALERTGVSATVLWTALTGFATVGAVAFFAAWSVLSNLFCALLIFTVRPFRIGDYIEVLDTAEKVGAIGRVEDINLLYTTLHDHVNAHGSARLLIPNALVFQRVVRRFQGIPPPVGSALVPAAPVSAPAPVSTPASAFMPAPAPAQPAPADPADPTRKRRNGARHASP